MTTQKRLECLVGALMAHRDFAAPASAKMMQEDLLKYAPEETAKIQKEIDRRLN